MDDAVTSESAGGFKYDLFVSYSTDPDYRLVRDLESFLESFHRLKTPRQLPLRELEVCIDGSDFSLAKLRDRRGDEDAVSTLIEQYLAQSRQLLVLCSRGAAQSHWVDLEVRWFAEHRGGNDILLAVTEGATPGEGAQDVFPPTVVAAGLHRKPWYDFRQYKGRAASGWSKVKQYDDERVRLAADLNGLSAGDVQPIWYREQARARRQRWIAAGGALAIVVIAGVLAVYQYVVAQRELALKLISDAYEQLYRDPSAAVLNAYRASELLPGAASRNALDAAYKVAVLRHYNRRETAQITGSGPSYLAGRWKQGETFSRTSPDGRYGVVVSERGADGAAPPGDVYLLNNESLHTTKLESCFGGQRRVEDVSFDQTSRDVFVTRHYQLDVYSLAGQCVGRYDFSCCTKSPVHLVEGYVADRYVLAAETKGGLWLADPHDAKSRIELQREFQGDAAILATLSEDRRAAVVVFESGRVATVAVDRNAKPVLREITKGRTLFAAFDPHRNDRLVTAGEDGVVRHWRLDGDRVVETGRQNLGTAGIDWVAFSDDGTRMLAVADDDVLYVVAADTGKVLVALDDSGGIDWAAARAVPLQRRDLRLDWDSAVTFSPYPDASLEVVRTLTAGGSSWIVAEKAGDSVRRRTYVVDGDKAMTFAGLELDAQSVERHGDWFWIRTQGSEGASAGRLLRVDGARVAFFPRKDLGANAVVDRNGRQYVATSAGLYAIDGSRLSRLTNETMSIRAMTAIGGDVWLATRQGAYVLQGERLVRASEPFLDVRDVRKVGDDVWLLTRNGDFFGGSGPAYRVERYRGRPLPNGKAQIDEVVSLAGRTWLLGTPGLYVVAGERAEPVGPIAEAVIDLREVDGRLVARTRTIGLFATPGPTYEIDEATLRATKSTGQPDDESSHAAAAPK